jgi:pyruvate/2-oxoglutarate dehydrogenase complex dihydrolipoamide dehydrogenase (E3) component
MDEQDRFDAIVIGTGQSGKPLAIALAKAGRKTAVVERRHVGGTCINVGCTPTKTMVASARAAYLAHRAADYGVRTGPVAVDMAAVYRRKQDIVESWRASGQKALQETPNLELIFGEARFTGPQSVAVELNAGGRRDLRAATIIINTGGRPARPPITGLGETSVLDSSSILDLQVLPEHLIVLGGGYIGLEFGQMFRRFGSRVTLVERGPRIASREDPDVSEALAEILREDGVDVLFNAQAQKIEMIADTEVELTASTPQGTWVVDGTHLLVALGRTPNTAELNLSAAGVVTDAAGYIRVNDQLETNVPGIYAIGDVKGGPAFTHISYDDFRVLRENLLHGGKAGIGGRPVPNTVFTDPQLATVGLNETAAGALGRDIRVAKLPMSHVARAIEMGETRGFMKAIVDAGSGEILGCTVLGVEGGEIMAMLQIAMMAGIPYHRLKEGIFAHPTLAESLNNLFLTLEG